MKRLAFVFALLAAAAHGAPVGANEIVISSPSGGVARVNLFGGVVTSWVPADGTEVFAMAKPYAACARHQGRRTPSRNGPKRRAWRVPPHRRTNIP